MLFRSDDYMKYYEEAINHTSKKHAPWFIIPADDKEMQKLTDIKEPELDPEVKSHMEIYRNQLEKE